LLFNETTRGGHRGSRSRPIHDIDAPDPPKLLTVEEAGAVLRIGRSLAYKMAALYVASGGVDGSPGAPPRRCAARAVDALRELITTGSIMQLCPARQRPSAPLKSRRRRQPVSSAQLTLLDS
jgi:hypothetical protein